MTLAIDTSALVKRYLREPGRDLVIEAMDADPQWCASALTRTEVLVALHRSSVSRRQQQALWSTFRDDWDAMVVIPVDDRCLGRAVEIGAGFGIRTVDAIHLAAADRLPRPARYLTFDRRQIPAAASLGLEVVSPVEA
jgi:predicted nucleic acid-binding protein